MRVKSRNVSLKCLATLELGSIFDFVESKFNKIGNLFLTSSALVLTYQTPI